MVLEEYGRYWDWGYRFCTIVSFLQTSLDSIQCQSNATVLGEGEEAEDRRMWEIKH